MSRSRVAVLISGRGSNLKALIEAATADDYPAEIALVLSNAPNAAGLSVAAAYGIPAKTLNHRDFGRKDAGRAEFEAAIDDALRAARIDFVCLAGFMRLLSEPFTTKWRGRMINIHPSLLPAFKGLDVHQRMIDAGVKLAGCTVHFVSAEMDDGAIIGQAAVPVFAADDAASLAARILAAEHRLYPACLRALADGSVRIGEDGRAVLTALAPSPDPTDVLAQPR